MVAGFPVTPAYVLLLVFLRLHFRFLAQPWTSVAALALMSLPLVTAWASRDTLAISEFLRTYCLWIVAAGSVVIAVSSKTLRPDANYTRPALISLGLVATFSIAQYVVATAISSDVLFNPWRRFTYLYSYDVFARGEVRASGFYLEPSFNALVMVALLFMVLMTGQQREQALAVGLAAGGILATRSLAGYVAFLLLLIFFVRNAQGVRRLGVMAGIGSLGSLALLTNDTPQYVARRATSVAEIGSSGNYRLVQPVELVQDVLFNHPLGKPLGSVEATLLEYDFLNGVQRGSSLDNGLYLLIFYTGWVVLVLLLSMGVVAALQAARLGSGRKQPLLGFVILLVLLQFSGGVLLPEFILLAVVLVWTWRVSGQVSAAQPVRV